MKKSFLYCLAVMLILAAGSCEQKFDAEPPEILSFTYEPMPASAGAYIVLTAEVQAENAVIWVGTENSDYDAYLAGPTPTNQGLVMSLEYDKLNDIYVGTRSNRYTEPGNYKVVLVVSNAGDLGESIERKIQIIDLEVQSAE